MRVDVNALAAELAGVFKPGAAPDRWDPTREAQHIARLTSTLRELDAYEFVAVRGAGSSGIVVLAVYTPHRTRRAVKFPRIDVCEGRGDAPGIRAEVEALTRLSHESITRLYEVLKDGERCQVLVTEFVEEAKSLAEYAAATCIADTGDDDLLLEVALTRLAVVIREVAAALGHMHRENLVHFDVKPDNVLVDGTGRPRLVDLGFAREIRSAGETPEVECGFTWKYAHPRLSDPYQGARVDETPAKARIVLPASEVRATFDLFAFGRTLQEILKSLADVRGQRLHSQYPFNFLHLVAALCLDGRNATTERSTLVSFVSDMPLSLPAQVFKDHAFTTMQQVTEVLDRLTGRRRIETEVPELEVWSSSTINVSDGGPTTITDRVMAVVQHPALQRLANQLQLGMLDTVFPTATHTRWEHSLGVYHAAREYISALYYDNENPTFRVLVRPADIERTLLAALIHDVGQTTLGHDMEQVSPTVFSHTAVIKSLLDSRAVLTPTDSRTLREVIDRPAPHGWNAGTVDEAQRLYSGTCKNPLEHALHDILDGLLDADKLDYLVRDSVDARVQYGHGIDRARFLLSLTTKPVESQTSGRASIRLAIRRKGIASAEAFGFARYQLYQSLYWHHTYRAVEAMLLDVAASCLRELNLNAEEGTLTATSDLARTYYMFVYEGRTREEERLAFSVPQRSKTRESPVDRLRRALERTEAGPPVHTKYASDRTVLFLWRISQGKTRQMLEDLLRRRYYRRLIEIPLGQLAASGRDYLEDSLNKNRVDFREKVESALLATLRAKLQDQSQARESWVKDELARRAESASSQRTAVAVDLPVRGRVSTGDAPALVSDYKRRYFRYAPDPSGAATAVLWETILPRLMDQAAHFRIYCEPDLHQIITRVLSAEDVFQALHSAHPMLQIQSQP